MARTVGSSTGDVTPPRTYRDILSGLASSSDSGVVRPRNWARLALASSSVSSSVSAASRWCSRAARAEASAIVASPKSSTGRMPHQLGTAQGSAKGGGLLAAKSEGSLLDVHLRTDGAHVGDGIVADSISAYGNGSSVASSGGDGAAPGRVQSSGSQRLTQSTSGPRGAFVPRLR
jgi:hypothetical protein